MVGVVCREREQPGHGSADSHRPDVGAATQVDEADGAIERADGGGGAVVRPNGRHGHRTHVGHKAARGHASQLAQRTAADGGRPLKRTRSVDSHHLGLVLGGDGRRVARRRRSRRRRRRWKRPGQPADAKLHELLCQYNRHRWPAQHVPQRKDVGARVVRHDEQIGIIAHSHARNAIVRTCKPLDLPLQRRLARSEQQQRVARGGEGGVRGADGNVEDGRIRRVQQLADAVQRQVGVHNGPRLYADALQIGQPARRRASPHVRPGPDYYTICFRLGNRNYLLLQEGIS